MEQQIQRSRYRRSRLACPAELYVTAEVYVSVCVRSFVRVRGRRMCLRVQSLILISVVKMQAPPEKEIEHDLFHRDTLGTDWKHTACMLIGNLGLHHPRYRPGTRSALETTLGVLGEEVHPRNHKTVIVCVCVCVCFWPG